MSFTLEQARTLEAVARLGSFAKAAAHLHKAHSAVVYSLKTMEDAAGVALFDRSGYRTTLTPLGRRVLAQCEELLAASDGLDALVKSAREGYEPYLKVVFDGLLPVEPILAAASAVAEGPGSTEIFLYSEFLGGVDARAAREEADIVLAVLPVTGAFPATLALPELISVLVAHKGHPLARQRRALTLDDLGRHDFLTVHGSDQRLRMSTATLVKTATLHLSDFHAKKAALMRGMGYGWMPEPMIAAELKKKQLVPLRWSGGARHAFQPTLHWQGAERAGNAARAFVEALATSPVPRPRKVD